MSQWTSSFSLIGPTGSTGPVGPFKSATDYGSYLYYDSSGWIVGSTSVSLGTDAGLIAQGSNAVAIGYKAGETNQPAGSIILNAGGTGLNGTNPGLYIKPIREVPPNGQEGLFYDTTTHEVIHNSIITLSSQNTIVVGGSIVPDSTLAYSLGTPALRFADAYFGPSTIHIGDDTQSVTIGMNANGTLYTSGGLVVDNLVIGSSDSGYYSIVTSNNNLLMNRANEAGASMGPTMSLNDTSLRSTIVSIGSNAGSTIQNNFAIAIGNSAGRSSQGSNAVAIGYGAGSNSQGQNAIAIGYLAAQSTQNSNSIVLNASGSGLQAARAGFFVNPVRNDESIAAGILHYNTTTSEFVYGSVLSGSSATFSTITTSSISGFTLSSQQLFTSSVGLNGITGTSATFSNINGTSVSSQQMFTSSLGINRVNPRFLLDVNGSVNFAQQTLTSSLIVSTFGGSTIIGPSFSLTRANNRDIGFANTISEMNGGFAHFQVLDNLSAYSSLINGYSDLYFYASNAASSLSFQFLVSSVRRNEPSPGFVFWDVWNPNVPKNGYIFPGNYTSLIYGISTFGEVPVQTRGIQASFISSINHRATDSIISKINASTFVANHITAGTSGSINMNGKLLISSLYNSLALQESAMSNANYIHFQKPNQNAYIGWAGYGEFGVQNQSTFIIDSAGSNSLISLATSNTIRMTVANNGYVGIGTQAPLYPFSVSGAASGGSQAGYLFYANTTISNAASYSVNASIYATNTVWSATGFFVTSDERIKNDIADIDDGAALSTLRMIEPKTYTYIDELMRGSNRVYGFVSQQVSSVFQNAVRSGSDYIPNFYSTISAEVSTIVDTTYISVSNLSESFIQSLRAQINTKIAFYDAANSQIITTVSSIGDNDATFITTDNVVPYVSTGTTASTLFLYGTQVDDLLILNKEYLFTLNVAATQEIDRTQQSALQRIAELEATVQAQQSTIEYLLSHV